MLFWFLVGAGIYVIYALLVTRIAIHLERGDRKNGRLRYYDTQNDAERVRNAGDGK